jgi:hypothetical protein
MLINNPIENLNRKIETKIYIFNVDNQCNFKLFKNIEENMFFFNNRKLMKILKF